MDGFAVRAVDAGGEPLPIVGESAAGSAFGRPLPPGAAVRISTGAAMPAGADCVVPIEQARVEAGAVAFSGPVAPGQFIRWRGGDVAAGAVLLPRGTVLSPAKLAFLTMFGLQELQVFDPPKVAVLTSGDELRLLGQPLGADQIVASSLYYLQEELRRCGCAPRLLGIAPDDADTFTARLAEAVAWADIVVTTAGVSVGTHDVVGEAVRRLGGQVHFWKVAVRPGKPMLVASFGRVLHFGFPGNPVSTCCNTEIFLKPLLRQAFGIHPPILPTLRLPLAAPCPVDAQRLFFVYARLVLREGRLLADPLPNQNSGNLLLAAQGDALIVMPPGAGQRPAGEEVEVLRLGEGLG